MSTSATPTTQIISGDINGDRVCDSDDVKLFTNILDDPDLASALSNGISTDKLEQLNTATGQTHDLAEWSKIFNRTVSDRAGITGTQLTALRDSITWNNDFKELGINLPSKFNAADGVTWEDLEGTMTEGCFRTVFAGSDRNLSLAELQSAKEMLQSVATSGVLGTNSLAGVFSKYSQTDTFFTVDLEAYARMSEQMGEFATAVGAGSVWDLMKNLIHAGIDIGYDSHKLEVQEIDLDKLDAFCTKVRALKELDIMGAGATMRTAYDKYLENRFTVDASQLTDSVKTNLENYLKQDNRVHNIWELLIKLKTANSHNYDLGLTASDEVIDLNKVDTLVSNFMNRTVEGGGAGLVSRVRHMGYAGLLLPQVRRGAIDPGLTTFEREVLTSISGLDAFSAATGDSSVITPSQLDAVIERMQTPLF